jgi:serine/threonine protein kinase
MKSKLDDIGQTVQHNEAERSKFLDQIKALEIEIKASQEVSLRQIPHLPLDVIDLPDNRVEILESDPSGQPQQGKYYDRYVRFERIHRDPRDQLARLVGLYRQMGDVALVQKFFAIVENQGIKYGLMEDMSGDDSIAKAIESGRWTALTQSEKFRIAYELAATISALHAAGVVVKVIADHSVYLQRTPDGLLRPKLTNLRHARAVSILERVTSIDII